VNLLLIVLGLEGVWFAVECWRMIREITLYPGIAEGWKTAVIVAYVCTVYVGLMILWLVGGICAEVLHMAQFATKAPGNSYARFVIIVIGYLALLVALYACLFPVARWTLRKKFGKSPPK